MPNPLPPRSSSAHAFKAPDSTGGPNLPPASAEGAEAIGAQAQRSLQALREWARDYKLCLEGLADCSTGLIVGERQGCELSVREKAARIRRARGEAERP